MALTFGTLLSSQRTNTHHHEPPHLAVRSGMTQCEHTSRPSQAPHGLAGVLSSCNALRVSSVPLWDSQPIRVTRSAARPHVSHPLCAGRFVRSPAGRRESYAECTVEVKSACRAGQSAPTQPLDTAETPGRALRRSLNSHASGVSPASSKDQPAARQQIRLRRRPALIPDFGVVHRRTTFADRATGGTLAVGKTAG